MTIEISDTIIRQSGLSQQELKLELAVVLFQREKITLGQASKMADLHQFEFQKELSKRKIPIHYNVEDFERDLQTIKSI